MQDCSGCFMPLKLSDAGLAVVTGVVSRLPWRLRGTFLQELAAAFAGHENDGLRKIAVDAAKRVVRWPLALLVLADRTL
jgi:hypothetical protein